MNQRVFHAPEPVLISKGCHTIFIGGSIEMGTVIDWQSVLIPKLLSISNSLVIFNPRRPNWDANWVQSIENPEFNEQVKWETDQLDLSDFIFLFFHPETKAPITLLELGLYARDNHHGKKILVCCQPGFWRKGNVDFICKKHDIPQISRYEDCPDWLVRNWNS